MDFHTLPRKQLQTLCKKNKIPANITNVAMADALAALNKVEGLDDFLNPIEGDAGTPSVNHRTAVRTPTQRKTAREEAEGSKVKALTRRVRVAEEVVEQENKDANVPPITPAASRRRATAVSTRRKKEVEMAEEDSDKNGVQGNPKTPAPVAPMSRRRATGRSVCTTKIVTPCAGGTSAYNTRRSVRLLEKDLSKMNLIDTEDIGPVKIEVDVSQESSNVSHQAEYLYDTGKGDSLQMESTMVSEDIQELQVCSLEKNTEYECQSRDLDSNVKLVPVTEINMVVEPHGPNEAGSKKVNCLELEAEPNASDEAGSKSLPVLEESSDSSEPGTVNKECFGARKDILPVVASEDASLDVTDQDIVAVTVVVPDDVSVGVTHQEVAAIPMQSECIMDDQVSNEGDDKEDKNNETRQEDEPNDSNLNLEGSFGTCDKSDDAGFEVLPVLEESAVVMQDILPSDASQDAPMEVAPQDTATLAVVVADDVFDQDVAGSLPMSPVNGAPENSKGDDNQDMNDETEDLNLADGNMADEDCQHLLNVDESDSMTGSEGVLELDSISHSNGECQEEELETKAEQLEAETEKIDSTPDVTASLENSGAAIEGLNADYAFSTALIVEAEDHKNNLKNLTPDVTASLENSGAAIEGLNADYAFSTALIVEAEDHKNNLKNLEAEAQAEESEEPVAGEDVMLEAGNAFSRPQISLVHQQVSVESGGSYILSCPLDGELSCKSNTLVDGDVVSADAAITNKETMTEDSIQEQKGTDIAVQSDRLKGDVQESKMMKENVTSDDLSTMSIGELKRRLKQLTLNDKSKSKTNDVKDVEKKRTALQVLPQNQMKAGEAQI